MSSHRSRSSLLGGQADKNAYRQYSDSKPMPLGSPASQPARTQPSRSGIYMPRTKWQWAFVLVALAQALLVLGCEIYIFARFHLALRDGEEDAPENAQLLPRKSTTTFLTLYIFGFLYQLVLVYDALQQKNTIQIIGLCIYNVGLLIYGSVQRTQIDLAVTTLAPSQQIDPQIADETKPLLISIPCILALGTVLLSLVAWKLYDEFAWTIYKHISADLRLKRRYLTYQIYIALLKFDFFFFLGFTVQFVVIVIDRKSLEFALTLAAIPITIIILVLAAFFTRRENVWGMVLIIILYLGGLAYFLFKIVRIYSEARRESYLPAQKELTTFAALTIVLIIITIVNACICTHNFNTGLKPYIQSRKLDPADEKTGLPGMQGTELMGGYVASRPLPNRMEID